MFSSKPGGTKFLHKDGDDILWTHIHELFKLEQRSLLLERCRLSSDNVYLNSYSKVGTCISNVCTNGFHFISINSGCVHAKIFFTLVDFCLDEGELS